MTTPGLKTIHSGAFASAAAFEGAGEACVPVGVSVGAADEALGGGVAAAPVAELARDLLGVFLVAEVETKVLKVFMATSSSMLGMQSGSSQINLPVGWRMCYAGLASSVLACVRVCACVCVCACARVCMNHCTTASARVEQLFGQRCNKAGRPIK